MVLTAAKMFREAGDLAAEQSALDILPVKEPMKEEEQSQRLSEDKPA